MMIHCLLSLTIWIPIGVGLLILLAHKNDSRARALAILGALLGTILSLILFIKFDSSYSGIQFEQNYLWVSSLNIYYHLGVDGISLPFILLNNFITLMVVIASIKIIKHKVALYYSMFLIMTGLISGAFCALDAILFYVYFEAMLIPLYLIIGVWGGANRFYAAVKFFLYTLLGSFMMLAALIYLYVVSNQSFEIFNYYHVPLAMLPQILLFIAFIIAFGIKIPMFPLHTWLPDAYSEAPTGGTVVLSAVAVKIGGYGLLRFLLPIVPDAARYLATTMVILSLIAIVYFSLIAIVQKDMKRMMAYSSVAHMGFVTLGVFLFMGMILNPWAVEGAMVQMISHGFVSAAVFLCIGVLFDRMNTCNIADFGGVVNKMPVFAALLMLFAMANVGLPGTSGFVGEFMVIMGAVQVKLIYAFFAATVLVLGAAYTLWVYKKAIFGTVTSKYVAGLHDVNTHEFIVLALLGLIVILIGVYPEIIVAKMHIGVRDLITQVANSKLG